MDGSRIRVSFENGMGGVFDCAPYLKDKYWASLANPAFFRQVRVDCGTLCWPNDIDIDPEEIWDFMKDSMLRIEVQSFISNYDSTIKNAVERMDLS